MAIHLPGAIRQESLEPTALEGEESQMIGSIALSLSLTPPTPPPSPRAPLVRPPPTFVESPTELRPTPPEQPPAPKARPPRLSRPLPVLFPPCGASLEHAPASTPANDNPDAVTAKHAPAARTIRVFPGRV